MNKSVSVYLLIIAAFLLALILPENTTAAPLVILALMVANLILQKPPAFLQGFVSEISFGWQLKAGFFFAALLYLTKSYLAA